VDPQVLYRRKSRAQAKSNRNRRNRRVRRDVTAIVNNLLDEVEKSLLNLPPAYPPPSSPHIPSPISEEWFPSPFRYDPVSLLSSPLPPLSPIHASSSPPVSPRLLSDFSPLSPSPFSTFSVEFLAEIPAPSPPPWLRRIPLYLHCYLFSSIQQSSSQWNWHLIFKNWRF